MKAGSILPRQDEPGWCPQGGTALQYLPCALGLISTRKDLYLRDLFLPVENHVFFIGCLFPALLLLSVTLSSPFPVLWKFLLTSQLGQSSQLPCLLHGHPELCRAGSELRVPVWLSCTELAQLAQAWDAAYLPMEKPPMDNEKWL